MVRPSPLPEDDAEMVTTPASVPSERATVNAGGGSGGGGASRDDVDRVSLRVRDAEEDVESSPAAVAGAVASGSIPRWRTEGGRFLGFGGGREEGRGDVVLSSVSVSSSGGGVGGNGGGFPAVRLEKEGVESSLLVRKKYHVPFTTSSIL